MVAPDSSQLTKPYPSDPARRYRQNRVGQPVEGTPTNQVWTVTLNATGGSWIIIVQDYQKRNIDPLAATVFSRVLFTPTAAASVLQTLLEGQVGAGNVTVTGGPGASGGGTPYVVTFLGALANQRIHMASDAQFMTGGAATATLVETAVGGTAGAVTPIGPDLSTNTLKPANSPRAREDDPAWA